jgi:drug/metabolite transporter (DMT)-like permease
VVELVASAVLFGLAGFVAKRATGSVDGAQVAFIRFLVGLAFLVVLALVRRAPLRPRHWGVLAVRGVFGGVASLLYFVSLNELPIGTTSLLSGTSPAFAAGFAAIFLGERLSLSRVGALVIAGAGIVLTVYGQGRALGGSYLWQGMALLAGITAGASITAIRAARQSDGPWEVFAAFCVVGALCTGPLALIHWRAPSGDDWILLLLVGVLALGGQILMTHAYGVVETATGVTISQITVVMAMLLGYFLDDEAFAAPSLIGSGLIIGGGIWAVRESVRETTAVREV